MRLIFLLLSLVLPHAVAANERVALVIGMSDYSTVVKLDNTINDAIGISETLSDIGFRVNTLIDGTGEQLRNAVDEFSFRSETAELALIYFAGHGVEVQGENFLIPIDADVSSNKDVQRQAISLKELLAAVNHARKMRIVILDSCRDNPFGDSLEFVVATETATPSEQTRSAGRAGLAAPSPDRGTLVAFAARDGERALDGSGDNSPFALALMDNLAVPGLEISLMFRQVRDAVLKSTQNQQEPHTYGSLPGRPFYIAGASNAGSVVSNADLRVAWADIQPDQEAKLSILADQGDTRSMIGLAYMRLNTEDSRFDPKKAADLLNEAADSGSAEAQFELGQLYEIGLGVEQDVKKAIDLFKAAADADFADAINDLGFLYFQGGLGIARDPEKAFEYFERAADLRHPQAMFNYAALIDDGLIPKKGPEEAADYLYQSLRSGSTPVFELLRDRPTMFKLKTRKALQLKLSEHAFYAGVIDGDFGAGTQRGIKSAYGVSE